MKEQMKLEPAYTVFVDESGAPTFHSDPDLRVRGYVSSAVLVPELKRVALEANLPRNSDGHIMKFSDRDISDTDIANCLNFAFDSELLACAVLLQLDSVGNIDHAEKLTQYSNKQRKKLHNRGVKKASLMYQYMTQHAVMGVWACASTLDRGYLGYFDVVFDDGSISRQDRELLLETLPKTV